jgi:hypothetical protein
MIPKGGCSGCGSTDREQVEFEYGPLVTVMVCGGALKDPSRPFSARHPKAACVRAYIAKDAPCPGCGRPSEWAATHGVCRDCHKRIADMLRAEASADTTPRRWWEINDYRLFNVDDDQQGPSSEVTEKLALSLVAFMGANAGVGKAPPGTIIAGTVPMGGDRPGLASPLEALLTDKQAKAMDEFARAARAWGQRLYDAGKAYGGNMLVRLARGEVTVDEFEDGRKPKNKRARR